MPELFLKLHTSDSEGRRAAKAGSSPFSGDHALARRKELNTVVVSRNAIWAVAGRKDGAQRRPVRPATLPAGEAQGSGGKAPRNGSSKSVCIRNGVLLLVVLGFPIRSSIWQSQWDTEPYPVNRSIGDFCCQRTVSSKQRNDFNFHSTSAGFSLLNRHSNIEIYRHDCLIPVFVCVSLSKQKTSNGRCILNQKRRIWIGTIALIVLRKLDEPTHYLREGSFQELVNRKLFSVFCHYTSFWLSSNEGAQQ